MGHTASKQTVLPKVEQSNRIPDQGKISLFFLILLTRVGALNKVCIYSAVQLQSCKIASCVGDCDFWIMEMPMLSITKKNVLNSSFGLSAFSLFEVNRCFFSSLSK